MAPAMFLLIFVRVFDGNGLGALLIYCWFNVVVVVVRFFGSEYVEVISKMVIVFDQLEEVSHWVVLWERFTNRDENTYTGNNLWKKLKKLTGRKYY